MICSKSSDILSDDQKIFEHKNDGCQYLFIHLFFFHLGIPGAFDRLATATVQRRIMANTRSKVTVYHDLAVWYKTRFGSQILAKKIGFVPNCLVPDPLLIQASL